MSLNRRQFLKNTSIGTAGLIGGASMLRKSAFAGYPAPATSDVSFVGGSSSYTGGRKQMIKDVLAPLQSVISAAISGKTVIIKPNLVYASSSGTQAVLNCTHVDAVAGVIEFLRSINSSLPIIVAEASAATTTTMYGYANYNSLTSTYSNVTLVDLNTSTTYTGTTKHLWKTDLVSTQAVSLSSIFFDSNNYIISLTRPKTHYNMCMTGTVKNICMGAPLTKGSSTNGGSSKDTMHGITDSNPSGKHTGEDKCLAYNIYQVASQITAAPYSFPSLAVLDAWEGQEGNGPIYGTSIMQYCALAGTDFLAVDRLCAVLLGFSDTAIPIQPTRPVTPSYTDMRTLVWMSNSGFGNYDLSKINFINGTLANLRTFVISGHYIMPNLYREASNTSDTVSTSWETMWFDSTDISQGPKSILDTQLTGVRDGAPFMNPQANLHMDGIVCGNEVKIDLALPHDFSINLHIMNMQGQEIRRLGNEHLNSGRYSIIWDCRDNHGARVPNGTYLIRLQFGQKQLVCDKVSLAR